MFISVRLAGNTAKAKFNKRCCFVWLVVEVARIPYLREEVEIPENVELTVEGMEVRVKGPLGELVRDFSHVHKLLLSKENNKVILEMYFADKRGRAAIKTIASHIRNMIIGVTRGFRYKMKIIYAHYPMEVKVDEKNRLIIIRNFIGEKSDRYARIEEGVKVKVTEDDVIVEGIDIDAVGRTAANIHLATHLAGKLRKSPHGREGGPGILDGIYLYEKEHIK